MGAYIQTHGRMVDCCMGNDALTQETKMALRKINAEWKYMKTFATEANLEKAIAAVADHYPEYDDRYVVVRTPEGRYTAIVSLDMSKGGYIGRYDFLKI